MPFDLLLKKYDIHNYMFINKRNTSTEKLKKQKKERINRKIIRIQNY